jgi:hypothetical protein
LVRVASLSLAMTIFRFIYLLIFADDDGEDVRASRRREATRREAAGTALLRGLPFSVHALERFSKS